MKLKIDTTGYTGFYIPACPSSQRVPSLPPVRVRVIKDMGDVLLVERLDGSTEMLARELFIPQAAIWRKNDG